ncbi:MAG: COG3650 family protein [Saprospiraceae bacterium]
MIRSLLVFSTFLLLAACTPKATPGVSPTDGGATVKGEQKMKKEVSDMPSDGVEQVFVGLYRQEDGRLEFIPCDEPTKKYWVLGETERLTDLYESAIRQGYEGQNVVASVRGTLKKAKPSKGAAMASPYDAQLFVKDVVKVRAKNFRNTCVPFDFWGLGNEPFWSLQISEAEGIIEFSKIGAPTEVAKYVKPSIESDGLRSRYFMTFPSGQRMKVAVTKEKCEDSMAGNPYEYSIEVSYNGEVLQGCATKNKL